MDLWEILGGAGFLLFFFASIALTAIVLARLLGVIEAWVHSRRATPTLEPEMARARKPRAARVLGCTRFSIVDTTHRRETGGRR